MTAIQTRQRNRVEEKHGQKWPGRTIGHRQETETITTTAFKYITWINCGSAQDNIWGHVVFKDEDDCFWFVHENYNTLGECFALEWSPLMHWITSFLVIFNLTHFIPELCVGRLVVQDFILEIRNLLVFLFSTKQNTWISLLIFVWIQNIRIAC